MRVPVNSPLLVRDFFTKTYITVIPKPPYSPDLAAADFSSSPSRNPPLRDEDLPPYCR
jgi:hypothetical protein